MFSGKGRDTSFLSSEVSSGTTNTGTKVEILLPNFKASEFKFCGRAETVGKQPGIIKQQSNSKSFVTTGYSKRCIKKGMESILQGSASGGQWKK